MKTPLLDSFFEKLKTAPKAYLMTDYDGTLAPFVKDPQQAYPYPEVKGLLESIMKTGKTHLMIVSGRSLETLFKLLNLNPTPELWGSHGGERWAEGKTQTLSQPQLQKGLKMAEKELLKSIDKKQLEMKSLSFSVHWRGLDEKTKMAIQQKAYSVFEDITKRFPLEILPFKEGVELKQKSIGKSLAVDEVLKTCPEHAVIAYIGDDLTDEEAFKALGSRGLKILVAEKQRSTAADIQITPGEEVFDFFRRWIRSSVS